MKELVRTGKHFHSYSLKQAGYLNANTPLDGDVAGRVFEPIGENDALERFRTNLSQHADLFCYSDKYIIYLDAKYLARGGIKYQQQVRFSSIAHDCSERFAWLISAQIQT